MSNKPSFRGAKIAPYDVNLKCDCCEEKATIVTTTWLCNKHFDELVGEY